jgi:aspartyl-tRNA synthetase
MKKSLTIALVFAIIVLVASSVFAATASELVSEIYNKGSKYGVTKADLAKMEADIAKREEIGEPITDEEATAALAKVNEIAAILEAKGVESVKEGKEKLSKAELENIRTLAKEAGNAVGVTVTISVEGNKATISIYDPETKTTILTKSVNPETGEIILASTGASIASAVVASVAVIAVAVVAAVKVKKEA